MGDLAARAEEALLGAVISDVRQLADLHDVEASAFTDPPTATVHRSRPVLPSYPYVWCPPMTVSTPDGLGMKLS